MGTAARAEPPESESFERMRARMQALKAAAPPHVDPRALALRALLVTDHLAEPTMRQKVAALGRAGMCDPRSVDDLRMAARSLLYALSRRGDGSERGPSPEIEALSREAVGLKRAGIEAIDAFDSDDATLWLDVFRLPCEAADLVFDLRSIALLYDEHGSTAPLDPSAAALVVRRCADALEASLLGAAARGEWAQWVARAFSLTRSLYLEVCRIGRSLTRPDGTPLALPSIAGIARSARRNRSAGSYSQIAHRPSGRPPQPGATASERALAVEPRHTPEPVPAANVPTLVPGAMRTSPPPPAPVPAQASAPAPVRVSVSMPVSAPAQASVPPPAPVRVSVPAQASAPAPTPEPAPAPIVASERPPASAPDSARARRRFERLGAELEVSLLSDSNFYVGLTENLSEGGLFVATYVARPLGSHVEIGVRLPGRPDPLTLRGTVRWVRDYSPTSDGYPGMGIQFDALSESDHADIAAFLVTREALFFE
jgi:uncharacterized protein (TIGR02266 family)